MARRIATSDPRHRLFTDLAFSAFEAGHFAASLRAASQAVATTPHCPRSLWAHACALHLAGKQAEAIATYHQLITIGIRRIAGSCCCRHKAHTRGLIADCLLHLSVSLKAAGNASASEEAFMEHLDLRGPGCYSIYTLGALPDSSSALRARRPVV